MTAMDSIKAKFDEYEYLLRAATEKIEELAAENERLRAAGGAHAVLKDIYLNRNQPESLRAKAATAALPHETPKLTPVSPPLELTAEVIPLRQLVEQRRARADRNALTWDPMKLSGGIGDSGVGSSDASSE